MEYGCLNGGMKNGHTHKTPLPLLGRCLYRECPQEYQPAYAEEEEEEDSDGPLTLPNKLPDLVSDQHDQRTQQQKKIISSPRLYPQSVCVVLAMY